jgi:hypothetical protein
MAARSEVTEVLRVLTEPTMVAMTELLSEMSFGAEAATPATSLVTVSTAGTLLTVPVSPGTVSFFKTDVPEPATLPTPAATGATIGEDVTPVMREVGAAKTLEPRLRAATEMVMNFILTSVLRN